MIQFWWPWERHYREYLLIAWRFHWPIPGRARRVTLSEQTSCTPYAFDKKKGYGTFPPKWKASELSLALHINRGESAFFIIEQEIWKESWPARLVFPPPPRLEECVCLPSRTLTSHTEPQQHRFTCEQRNALTQYDGRLISPVHT